MDVSYVAGAERAAIISPTMVALSEYAARTIFLVTALTVGMLPHKPPWHARQRCHAP
jgi:hypothetical protein